MKLTKAQFCDFVETFDRMLQEEKVIANSLNVNAEWKPLEWVQNYFNMLEELCELEEDPAYGTDLTWFCFDTDFGRNLEMNKVYDAETGRTWRIEGPEILYDFITRND